MPFGPLPLNAPQNTRCALHVGLAAAWLCAACGRGHCGACQARTERRLTPVGTCLQCGGRLQPVQPDGAPSDTGLVATVKHAYGPLGLACAAALALPLLYGAVVPITFLPMALVTAVCAWIYFLAVVRWRSMGHAGLPTPALVLEDVRRAMAVLPGFLATLLVAAPLAYASSRDAGTPWLVLLGVAGLLWLPLPWLAAAASTSIVAPLVPLRVLVAVRGDPAGYLGMAAQVLGLVLAFAVVGLLLTVTVGRVPGVGPWLVATGVLPGAWAVALAIGRWGQAQAGEIGFDD